MDRLPTRGLFIGFLAPVLLVLIALIAADGQSDQTDRVTQTSGTTQKHGTSTRPPTTKGRRSICTRTAALVLALTEGAALAARPLSSSESW